MLKPNRSHIIWVFEFIIQDTSVSCKILGNEYSPKGETQKSSSYFQSELYIGPELDSHFPNT